MNAQNANRQVHRSLLTIAPIGGRNQDIDEDMDDNFDYMEMFETQVCRRVCVFNLF
jgi:hypothetical protein